jgi:hypothetical protein
MLKSREMKLVVLVASMGNNDGNRGEKCIQIPCLNTDTKRSL